jgi:GAF domain-containing protein
VLIIFRKQYISVLDTPVFINGELQGIVCFEATEKNQWDNEDINFSDPFLISIAFSI